MQYLQKRFMPHILFKIDKNHNAINYDDKYYIREQHSKVFMGYSDNCKENMWNIVNKIIMDII